MAFHTKFEGIQFVSAGCGILPANSVGSIPGFRKAVADQRLL